MTGMSAKNSSGAPDESLRRLGGILRSPSLVMSYGHTTPLAERAFLRRLGLSRTEADAFLEKMCERGVLDGGARELIGRVCAEKRITGGEAARLLLSGACWPEEGA